MTPVVLILLNREFMIRLSFRHWYYEDFIREENHKFPSLHLKKFSEMFFQACPLLERWRSDHDGAFDHFMRYKTRVPVCGAIMLNDTWDKVLLHIILQLTHQLRLHGPGGACERLEVFF